MNRPIVLLLGKDGQVGWDLQRSLSIHATIVAIGRADGDLQNVDYIRKIVLEYKPDIIVNAAAYTAVDQAELHQEQAYYMNASMLDLLAELALSINCWLVHYSTDYVFDGYKQSAYTEEDLPNPLSFYGKSKLCGEQAIQKHQGNYLIFRSSWVYSSRRANFPLAILKKAMVQDQLEVVADSIGAPTHSMLIADVTAIAVYRIAQGLLTENMSGIYHLTADGVTSWFDYAIFLVTQARILGMPLKLVPKNIVPISQSSTNALALRPSNSQLDTSKLQSQFHILLPNWKNQLTYWLSTIIHKDF